MKSLIVNFDSLPEVEVLKIKADLKDIKHFFVIYDQNLGQYNHFRHWLKQFSYTYPVEAGESLKAIESLPEHMSYIVEKLINIAPSQTCFLSVGGGTVGDFAGFAANIYKRGVELVHLPTTWLAAMDSAHGGKNALNMGSIKNQIGTYYPARSVVLVKDMLMALPKEQGLSAMGEMIKVAILDGKAFLKSLTEKETSVNDILWQNLDRAIKVKMSLVLKDPYEKEGYRQKLNLGHTLGHAIEAKFGLTHGLAVAQGLFFAIDYSFNSGVLALPDYEMINQVLNTYFSKQKSLSGDFIGNFRVIDLKRIIAHDKKLVDESRLNFIFVSRVGRAEVVKVAINNLIREAVKQGWAV